MISREYKIAQGTIEEQGTFKEKHLYFFKFLSL